MLVSRAYERIMFTTLIFFWTDHPSAIAANYILLASPAIYMDFAPHNPLRTIARTDDQTKAAFAKVLGKAILGSHFPRDAAFADRIKSRHRYASVGIQRKQDLCDELHRHAQKLQAVVEKNAALQKRISQIEHLATARPDIAREQRALARRRAGLEQQVDEQLQANHLFHHENELLAKEIATLKKALADEREHKTAGKLRRLEGIAQEYQKQTDQLEQQIGKLERRRQELDAELLLPDPDPEVLQATSQTASEALRSKKTGLQEELRRRQKEFLELKDQVEATNAKIGVQIRRAREDLRNK